MCVAAEGLRSRGKQPNRPAAAAGGRAASTQREPAAGRPVSRKASGPSSRSPPSGASPTPRWGFLPSSSGSRVFCFLVPSGEGQPRCGTGRGLLPGRAACLLPPERGLARGGGPTGLLGCSLTPLFPGTGPQPAVGTPRHLGGSRLAGVSGLRPRLPSGRWLYGQAVSPRRPVSTHGAPRATVGAHAVSP